MESYELGVQETEVRLADELAEVYRDYCKEEWMEPSTLRESLLPQNGGKLGMSTIL